MTLSNAKIRTRKPSDKRELIPMDGKGLYLIVEKHPLNSKRFEARMKFPRTRDGKTKYVSRLVFGTKIFMSRFKGSMNLLFLKEKLIQIFFMTI